MKIKVVSQNVRHPNDGPNHMVADRIPRVRELLKKYDPDIAGFQEVRQRWLDFLTEDFGEEYEIHHKYRSVNNLEAATMMWRKSKFDCLDKGYFWLSPTPHIESHSWPCGSDYKDYRIVMWATLREKESGVTFTYFNTHYSFGDERHCLSNQLIKDHIREAHIDAAVVTADYNFTNLSVGYRNMTKDLYDLNAATVNDFRTTIPAYKHNRDYYPIDFIFCTKDTIAPITYHLMDETFDGYFASDHFGIYGEFEVKEKLRLGSLDVNAAAPDTEENPLAARAKYSGAILQYTTEADLYGFQNVTEEWRKGMAEKYQKFSAAGLETAPIFYRVGKYEPVEEKELARCSVVVFRNCATKQKVCVINGTLPDAEAAALVQAEAEAHNEMPVFFMGSVGAVGNAAYEQLAQGLTDARRAVAPKDATPTYEGFRNEWVAPAITDMIFTNGVKSKLLEYKVANGVYGKVRVSDHNQVLVTVLLDNED